MLKADVKRFEDLASADETVRFEAANQLQQLDQFHFHDHPVGKFRFSVEKVASLLCAWHATHRDLIKGWIAQALALTENRSPEVLVLFRDTLKLDGPYMPVVAQLLYTYSTNVPGANELFKLLHRHPNPEVRWRSAMALSCMALAGELDYDKDMSILRTLMLDRHPNTRSDAIRAASRMQGLGLLDYEVLLDVVNTYSGRSRDEARELMVRLERLVAGCTPSAFAPREPLRRTDGVYRVDKAELDSDGVWISSSCLRFLSDGTVHYFGTNVAPVNFPKLRGEIDSKLARGVVNKDGAGITFSLAGGEHALDFEGHIDGDELHLRRTNRRTGERANEIYTWTYVDWNASVAGAPGPTKNVQ